MPLSRGFPSHLPRDNPPELFLSFGFAPSTHRFVVDFTYVCVYTDFRRRHEDVLVAGHRAGPPWAVAVLCSARLAPGGGGVPARTVIYSRK